ncbi:hypothetical protein SAMN05421688_1191 [Poseidonocella pacifica]|uniref:Uncharacterized protein n=1 Tax=Poseidonocella pacifica TaxID=871651 RepID=A0A1I0WA11_9RHOB|nr:hypothetical protein [Poseidonocella pacifica]SFA85559.1 hypothetical protein SAMN05421688_1191 [Poseidonocella pacifica]
MSDQVVTAGYVPNTAMVLAVLISAIAFLAALSYEPKGLAEEPVITIPTEDWHGNVMRSHWQAGGQTR